MLAAGTRCGVYEIQSALGAGGMGEVYRAHDTKLGRDVAIKILADSFVADPERVARFQREAQILAALNHPHIAAIYGFEESAGSQFLVMELVEGETLADRISRRAGPSGPTGVPAPKGPGLHIDEALAIARQIADALQAAHEKGIVHRDLKPANVALTSDGQVKVLDFGLAKTVGPSDAGSAKSPVISNSPTLTIAATQAGVILGTAAYMSPEQARGKVADKRSDIWAFGCVLYEMLTGKRPFEGEDLSETLAFVLTKEPDWKALPSDVSPALRALLRRCLERDRRRRVSDASTVLFVLDEAVVGGGLAPSPAQAGHYARDESRPLWRRALPATAAALMAAMLAGGGVWWLTRPAPGALVRTTLAASGATALTLSGFEPDVAITPDGSRIVYRGADQLLVRALDQIEPTVLSGLTGPRGPFVSPDGKWIGFYDVTNTLKKVAVTGGPAVTVSVIDGTGHRGATWGPDGTIVFATAAPATGLQRVSAAGGEPAVLTKPDRERGETDHLWPEFLPGGRAVLFTIAPVIGGTESMQIAVLDLQSGSSKVLIRGGSHARYVPSGHLVYGVAGTLRAVPFDLDRLEVVGTPALVLEGVVTTSAGAANVATGGNGSLVFVAGRAGVATEQAMVSVDRQGRATPLPGLPVDSYRDVRVSPDGRRLAVATQADLWTYDIARATRSRLTTDPLVDKTPLWAPDSRRIIFTSNRAGHQELFWRAADGTGSDQRLLTRAKDLVDLRANSWSTDGAQLLITEVFPSIQCAIGQILVEHPSDVKVLVNNESCNDFAAVSPDGRWMAYSSNVSGRYEIYVERYPELGDRQQISTAGGRLPRWSRDGRELFFIPPGGGQMLVVPVQSAATLAAGRPQVLFEFPIVAVLGGSHPYDLTPDGRFIVIRPAQDEAGEGPPSLVLVQNWLEELKRLVPVN